MRGLIVLSLLAVAMFALVFAVQALITPSPGDGNLAVINISITDPEGAVRHLEVETSAALLSDALLEYGLIEGERTPFGLFVISVGGVYADAANQEWWHFLKNGEPLMAGVDQTQISNGDYIEIEFMVGF